jgi:Na+-driven multidrug efflux pump
LGKAMREIMKIGIPAIVMLVSALFIEVINTAFVGHIGNEAMMAGVGMANMFVNIICLSVMFGISSNS